MCFGALVVVQGMLDNFRCVEVNPAFWLVIFVGAVCWGAFLANNH
jgi:hypothetical protein